MAYLPRSPSPTRPTASKLSKSSPLIFAQARNPSLGAYPMPNVSMASSPQRALTASFAFCAPALLSLMQSWKYD